MCYEAQQEQLQTTSWNAP